MTKRKTLLVLILLLTVISLVTAWFIVPVIKTYFLYSRLESEGLKTLGTIAKKREIRETSYLLHLFGGSRLKYFIEVEFEDHLGNYQQCLLEVSRVYYDEHEIGDLVQVSYLKDNPEGCDLLEHVGTNKNLSKFVSLMGLSLWILFVLVPGVIGVMLIRKGEGKMDIGLKIREMRCPECDSQMEAGYVPLISGINWRRREQPSGLLTVFSGLPGTVWWNPFKRPKLPGFHCPRCKVILFNYGKRLSQ